MGWAFWYFDFSPFTYLDLPSAFYFIFILFFFLFEIAKRIFSHEIEQVVLNVGRFAAHVRTSGYTDPSTWLAKVENHIDKPTPKQGLQKREEVASGFLAKQIQIAAFGMHERYSGSKKKQMKVKMPG